MSRIHFVGGEKGGVGKSVLSRLLAQYCIDRELPFRAYDADASHGAMLRYYADFSEPVDISRFESIDNVVEQTLETGQTAIMDLGAQVTRFLNRWASESALLQLADETGLGLTFWHVMDDGSDSVRLLESLLEAYGSGPDYVLVRNHGRGSDFSGLDRSGAAAKADALGARIMDLPALHAPTMRKIDHISASFWAAANNRDASVGPALGILERQRVRNWLNRSYEQLDSLLAASGAEADD
jgi:hypothetical protein